MTILASPAIPGTAQEIWHRIGLARPGHRPADPARRRVGRRPRRALGPQGRSAVPTHQGVTRPVPWVDSHCHIPGADADRSSPTPRLPAWTTMVTVGCDRASSIEALDLASRFAGVHATVGLHPHEARHGVDTIADLFDGPTRPVAVGECGLDYHYDHSPRDSQRTAFAAQIALAHRLDLPLVIHTREAWTETFAILDAEGVPGRTIFHCFTGGPDEARRCLDRGAFVSFSGIVTFPGATDVREPPPRSSRSIDRWSRPTARTSRRCRTAAGPTVRRGCRCRGRPGRGPRPDRRHRARGDPSRRRARPFGLAFPAPAS